MQIELKTTRRLPNKRGNLGDIQKIALREESVFKNKRVIRRVLIESSWAVREILFESSPVLTPNAKKAVSHTINTLLLNKITHSVLKTKAKKAIRVNRIIILKTSKFATCRTLLYYKNYSLLLKLLLGRNQRKKEFLMAD